MTTTTFTDLITDESQLRDVFGWPSDRSLNKAPCGRTFQYEACCQGPARCAVDSYLPRL